MEIEEILKVTLEYIANQSREIGRLEAMTKHQAEVITDLKHKLNTDKFDALSNSINRIKDGRTKRQKN